MTNAIDFRQVNKNFGAIQALQELTLTIQTGEVHALLGPNGAGKSTAIRILLGLLKATSGSVEVLGQDPWQDLVSLHRRLAYVPGDVNLWPTLTGGEAIELISSLRGEVNRPRISQLCEKFDFDPHRKGATYSKGNRQKVAIIAALASSAELFIFDEPTSGLDPLMELTFQSEVRSVTENGATVLLSSHILSEAESLADRISIIKNGHIIKTGTLADLQAGGHHTLRAVFKGEIPTLPELPGLEIARGEDWISCQVPVNRTSEFLAAVSGGEVVDFSFTPPTLEELFSSFYESDLS